MLPTAVHTMLQQPDRPNKHHHHRQSRVRHGNRRGQSLRRTGPDVEGGVAPSPLCKPSRSCTGTWLVLPLLSSQPSRSLLKLNAGGLHDCCLQQGSWGHPVICRWALVVSDIPYVRSCRLQHEACLATSLPRRPLMLPFSIQVATAMARAGLARLQLKGDGGAPAVAAVCQTRRSWCRFTTQPSSQPTL